MEGKQPSKCPDCGNYLLPWSAIALWRKLYISRPCPKSGCGYAITELLWSGGNPSVDTDDINEWGWDG